MLTVPFVPWVGQTAWTWLELLGHGQTMVSHLSPGMGWTAWTSLCWDTMDNPWYKGWALKAVNVGFVLSYWSIVLQDSLKLGLSNAITISV